MSLPIITRWLRRPLVGAALVATGMLAAGGAVSPAEAQYYPYYAYNPYYAPYCNPYYNPYGCPAAYGYPGYGYGGYGDEGKEGDGPATAERQRGDPGS